MHCMCCIHCLSCFFCLSWAGGFFFSFSFSTCLRRGGEGRKKEKGKGLGEFFSAMLVFSLGPAHFHGTTAQNPCTTQGTLRQRVAFMTEALMQARQELCRYGSIEAHAARCDLFVIVGRDWRRQQRSIYLVNLNMSKNKQQYTA
jgi:hypothetical protein